MPRDQFHQELQHLQEELLVMSSMVEKAIDRSVASLKVRDTALAQQVVGEDRAINQQRFGIEEGCLLLIARQQPMASDLRVLAAVLNIITDLERMGDHAAGIAKITLMIGNEPPLKPLIDIPRMAEIASEMLRGSLSAFVARDVAEAQRIAARDDEVDQLYEQVYRELLTFMMADPSTIDRATHLLWAAHNLERIADRVTNICERVLFLVTGRMVEIQTSPE
ncbi:MAG: phosphate signaling complex protein PhoU [Chloroflexota bacterium]|nr:phosphate signaling complex protein PhoU [Chloroflexota bacterium]MDQ5866445.1 phosphate signaling complex protein PhoU [Chloroflexota bacterium]